MSVTKNIEMYGVVAYKVAYCYLPGSDPVVAVFLSQVAYWCGRSMTGWCWITHEKMEEQTGLSRKQQDRAADVLSSIGVLTKTLKGVPAKIHYSVDFDMLDILVRTSLDVPNGQAVMSEMVKHTIEKITEENTTTYVFAPTEAAEPQSAGIATAVTAQAQTSPQPQAREEQIAPRRARSSPPPSSAAPPPSQEELSDYMKETWPWIPALEYEKCHAHHQARGWVDGKNKPWKDWRAVAKTWITNWKQFNADKWLEIQRFEQTRARQAAATQQRSLPDDF